MTRMLFWTALDILSEGYNGYYFVPHQWAGEYRFDQRPFRDRRAGERLALVVLARSCGVRFATLARALGVSEVRARTLWVIGQQRLHSRWMELAVRERLRGGPA